MAAAQDWRDFRALFTELVRREPRAGRIAVDYYPDGGFGAGVSVSGGPGEWEVRGIGGPPAAKADFVRLAEMAAGLLGHGDDQEAWVYWLEAIRLADSSRGLRHEWSITDKTQGKLTARTVSVVTIDRICEVSAEHCGFLAAGALKLPEGSVVEQRQLEQCSWSEMTIRFVSEEEIEFSLKGQTWRANYEELGLLNRKSRRDDLKPRKAWFVLMQLAQEDGKCRADRKELKKRAQEIRKVLREHLQQKGFGFPQGSDPLPCEDGYYRLVPAIHPARLGWL